MEQASTVQQLLQWLAQYAISLVLSCLRMQHFYNTSEHSDSHNINQLSTIVCASKNHGNHSVSCQQVHEFIHHCEPNTIKINLQHTLVTVVQVAQLLDEGVNISYQRVK